MPRLLVRALLISLAFAPTLGAQDSTARADSNVAELRKLDRMLDFLRARSAREETSSSPNAIDEGRFITLGGIPQWITIRGDDRHNPVLLLLHGGPGDATNPWGWAGLRPWRSRFTLVQWDQRGSGRTLGKNGASIGPTITLERMTQDGIELADSLRASLGARKLVLVGHSFGSILGVLMAKARPDLFYAFVGTGMVADPSRNYAVAYAELLAAEKRAGDATAVREIEAIGSPPWKDGRGFGVERKWANRIEGADRFIASMMGFAIHAPGSSLKDINDWIDGQILSGDRLVPVTAALPASALSGAFALPVVVIQGAADFTTPTSLAREWVRTVRAPSKAFVTIDGGHFAAFAHPEAFLAQLVARVLPLVKER